MFHDLIACIREFAREWKRRAQIRKYRASLKDDPSLPF